jgi:hypothetical protein
MADDSATTWRERLSQTFLKPPPARSSDAGPGAGEAGGPGDGLPQTTAEHRALINRIDARERRIGYGGSALAAVLAVVVAVANSPNRLIDATRSHKNWACTAGYELLHTSSGFKCQEMRSTWVVALVVPLVLALAILITVRIGRRAPLAFTILITGVASPGIEFAVPFLIAGGWLILRAWRTQRYGAPTAKAPIPGYEPPSRRTSPRAGSQATGTRAAGSTAAHGRGKQAAAGARKAPAPSKRYTPKAPKRKRPTPPPE